MLETITVLDIQTTSTLDERYRAGLRTINAALKSYHPDSNGNTDNNRRMTRILIAYKAKWTQTYKTLKEGE